MPEIAIVNIAELDPTTSVSGSMLFAVEIPSQGIKKITKDQVLKLFGTVADIQTQLGNNKFIGFDNSTLGYYYINGGPSTGIVVERLNKVYWNTTGNSAGILIDALNGIFALMPESGDGIFKMNLGGNILTMTLDENFTSNTTAYLGTSRDQQLFYNGALSNATGVSAENCQRSIMKVATTTNASNQINFPTTPKDGYTFELTVKGTITALTCTPDGGSTIEDAPTTATDENFKWCYNLAGTIWLRLF